MLADSRSWSSGCAARTRGLSLSVRCVITACSSSADVPPPAGTERRMRDERLMRIVEEEACHLSGHSRSGNRGRKLAARLITSDGLMSVRRKQGGCEFFSFF